MKPVQGWATRAVAIAIVASLLGSVSAAQQQSSPGNETPAPSQTAPAQTDQPLPDSPSSVAEPQSQEKAPEQSPPSSAPPRARQPVGTAVAEPITTTGVAASRPAGAAVAPAKQRRMRTILIAVGALAGAGVALGAVTALSKGSPSKPPGSR